VSLLRHRECLLLRPELHPQRCAADLRALLARCAHHLFVVRGAHPGCPSTLRGSFRGRQLGTHQGLLLRLHELKVEHPLLETDLVLLPPELLALGLLHLRLLLRHGVLELRLFEREGLVEERPALVLVEPLVVVVPVGELRERRLPAGELGEIFHRETLQAPHESAFLFGLGVGLVRNFKEMVEHGRLLSAREFADVLADVLELGPPGGTNRATKHRAPQRSTRRGSDGMGGA